MLSQFPLTFHHIHNKMHRFTALLMTILVMIGTFFVIIWEVFHGSLSFNSVLLLLLVNFVSRLRLQLMCMSLIKSIRSSLTHLHGFQLLVLLWQFMGITFVVFNQQYKSSEYKGKFGHTSNCCKRVLEAAKLAYANKTITSQKLDTFLSLLNKGVFSIGITFVDIHLNWLNWFHFLIFKRGLPVILIDCMTLLSPFLDVTTMSLCQQFLSSHFKTLEFSAYRMLFLDLWSKCL